MTQATILMKFNGEEYPYGTYDFDTPSERNMVNELAIRIRDERGCEVEVRRN